MKIVSALNFGREILSRSDSAELDARRLLAHVLQVQSSYLLAHGSEVVSSKPLNEYFNLIARAERHEPLPYIIGSVAFRYLNLHVTSDILIPRPETEELVSRVIQWAKRRKQTLSLVDVGTGSGCIAISLATELDDVTVAAVDVSADALAIAQQNAETYKACITFHQGSLLAPINYPIDAIIANLPYVTDEEMDALPVSVSKFEPSLALHGGSDGLDLIRNLLQQATACLKPDGAIFLEIGCRQGRAAKKLARKYFPTATVHCQQDYAGQDRFILVYL